jgi:hypothetical protein
VPGAGWYRALLAVSACIGCTFFAPSDADLTGGSRSLDATPDAATRDAGKRPDPASPPRPPEPGVPLPGPGDPPSANPPEPPDASADAGPPGCTVPVDCSQATCAGLGCDALGRRCEGLVCRCLGDSPLELDCSDGRDDDCDGLSDCADPDCQAEQCTASANSRCCSGRCVDTETDPAHCQGCDLGCAPGQRCVPVVDDSGSRGACTCTGTSQCPNNPGQICRQMNDDNQNDLCACDVLNTGNQGCAPGQVCENVPLANFCHYAP